MTPAARAQAAIECLDLVRASIVDKGRPADAILRDYFAGRRYAGAKDRAAIGELVFAAIRSWRELGWRMGVIDGLADGRTTILALLRYHPSGDSQNDAAAVHGMAVEQIFSGGYGPAPLSDAETAQLTAALPPMPDAVARNIPDWLETPLRQRFGARFAEECRALNSRAPLDLRINTLKTNRATARQFLQSLGFAVNHAGWSPLGLRLPHGTALGNLTPYKDGEIEVQDEASQFAALLTQARPGETVIDLCAGAGGKTLALAADMGNRGKIHAFDIRAGNELDKRAARAGAKIIEFRTLPREGKSRAASLAGLAGKADRVLVDAPCSGSGVWRRAPDSKWRLAPDHLARHIETQTALLAEAATLVKPGGRLVYATCSLLAAENEDQVAAFLAGHPEFRLIPYRQICDDRTIDAPPTLAGDARMLQFTPGAHGADGFFVAVLEKQG